MVENNLKKMYDEQAKSQSTLGRTWKKYMIIIGERINASRKTIFEAIEKKDVNFIQQEAINQVNAGAHYLDVNCGTNIKDEPKNMEWLVPVIQEVVDVHLVIDSPNPEALDSGLKLCKHKPIVNSITAEKERIKNIAPLVEKYNADVIALTITEEGMPHTAQERLDIAKKIIDSVKTA
ncbi:MAG: dihydropteroate synthase [Elusimicrobia bacterium]|nr:dihydropteroate synthase [Elusimicrobiota bacterium]